MYSTIIRYYPCIIIFIARRTRSYIIIRAIVRVRIPRTVSFTISNMCTVRSYACRRCKVVNRSNTIRPLFLRLYVGIYFPKNSIAIMTRRSIVLYSRRRTIIPIKRWYRCVIVIRLTTKRRVGRVLTIRFVRILVGRLYMSVSILNMRMRQLLLSITRDICRLPIMKRPNTRQLRMSTAIRLCGIPCLIILRKRVFRRFTREVMPRDTYLQVLRVTRFLRYPRVSAIFFRVRQASGVIPQRFIRDPTVAIVCRRPLTITRVRFTITTLHAYPILVANFVIFNGVINSNKRRKEDPNLSRRSRR